MLSPHEIAALILVKEAPIPYVVDPADLDTLLEYQLVTLEKRPSGRARPRLTQRGDSLLKAVSRSTRAA